MKNVLLISCVNRDSPAVRYRFIYPLDILVDEKKINYDFIHFYSSKTIKSMDSRNQFQKVKYVIMDFFKLFNILIRNNREYDVVIVKNFIIPIGGLFIEKLILRFIKYKDVLYDIDDGIYLNSTRQQNRIFSKLRNASKKVMFWTDKASKIFVSNDIIINDLKGIYRLSDEKFIKFLSSPFKNQYFKSQYEIEKEKSPSTVTFIWLGSPHTQSNLSLCTEFVKNLPEIVENVEVIIIGCSKGFNPFNNLDYVKFLEWNEEIEFEYMRKAHFGLNPLYNNEFEVRKSAFKVIQYYRAGVIPIASNVGINSSLIDTYGGYCTDTFQIDESIKSFINDSLLSFKDRISDIYRKSEILSIENNKEIIESAIFTK